MEKYEVSFTRSKSEFSPALFRIKYILEEKKKKTNPCNDITKHRVRTLLFFSYVLLFP